jgi:hypothetical protein
MPVFSNQSNGRQYDLQFNINEGNGLPSYFCTGSCAEFYFKPLRRILSQYIAKTKNIDVDLKDKSRLFEAIQDNGHIVGHYFDLRTQAYFREVMGLAIYWDSIRLKGLK